jgi:hypothetical protein
MSGQRVSTGIYLGDKLVKPIFGNQFMGINPFFQAEPTPVLTNARLMLDATLASSYPGTGNTWFDISGNGNDADVSLITSYWDAGGYFDWPGTDYTKIATVAHDTSLNIFGTTSSWTLMFVGTVDAAAGGLSDITCPFTKPSLVVDPGITPAILRNSSDGNYKKMFLRVNNSNLTLSSSTIFTTLGDWFVVHIVKSSTTINYYTTANTSIASFANSQDANNTGTLEIGRGRNDATANYRWDGKLAAVGIYNAALTSDQRLENINYFKDKLGF